MGIPECLSDACTKVTAKANEASNSAGLAQNAQEAARLAQILAENAQEAAEAAADEITLTNGALSTITITATTDEQTEFNIDNTAIILAIGNGVSNLSIASRTNTTVTLAEGVSNYTELAFLRLT